MTSEQYNAMPEQTRYALYQAFLLTLDIENKDEFIVHAVQCEKCGLRLLEQFAEFVNSAVVIHRSDLQRMTKASMN